MSELIYVNNAGTSWPKAPGVVEASQAALAAPPAASQLALQEAHALTCRSFGIEDPERLSLTGSCTAALMLLLRDLPLQAGDTVITSALEHHALAGPIARLALSRGVVHELAPYAPGAPLDLDFVRRSLRRGGVRLIAVSAASNVTGELLPIDALGRLAREHAVPLLLDAAQTACVTPIDVRTLPIDMLVFAAHKGPLAPHGMGGLWASTRVALESPSASCEVTPGAAAPGCRPFPGPCDVGSVNLAAAAGLAAALRWHHSQPGDVYARPRALAGQLRQRLRALPGCRVFGGEAVSYTATVSFLIDRLPLAQAEAHFARRGIVLRAGQHCAALALQAIGAPEGTVRVSFGPFNRDSDVDAVLAAAEAAAAGSP